MNTFRNWLIFLLLLVLDQLTKVWAFSYLSAHGSVEIIPGLFNLTLILNPGAAFGMFSGLEDYYRRLVLFGVSFVALVVVLHFMAKEARGDSWAQAALSAILAGAVGNILDRLRLDAVIDFLDFYLGTYHWPAFNVADSAITLGVGILILRVFLRSKEDPSGAATEVVEK